MTKLSAIDEEALRVLGRPPGPRMEARRAALVALCEAHWPKMRGPAPAGALTRTLGAIPPHLGTLFVHLYGSGDPDLAEVLDHLKPDQALALLVLTEIEHGNAEGAREAYAAMRLFASPAARRSHVRSVLEQAGAQSVDSALAHAHRPAFWRAVVGIARLTGRWETRAVLAALGLLAQTRGRAVAPADAAELEPILHLLAALKVDILEADDERIVHALRGEEQAPVSRKQLADILAEARQTT
jgi:hypothetical protein